MLQVGDGFRWHVGQVLANGAMTFAFLLLVFGCVYAVVAWQERKKRRRRRHTDRLHW